MKTALVQLFEELRHHEAAAGALAQRAAERKNHYISSKYETRVPCGEINELTPTSVEIDDAPADGCRNNLWKALGLNCRIDQIDDASQPVSQLGFTREVAHQDFPDGQ
jgi:hypothetical protein